MASTFSRIINLELTQGGLIYLAESQVFLSALSLKRKKTNTEQKTEHHNLSDLVDSPEKTDYIAGEILSVLGDESSKVFYRLVAAKIPESFIRKKLSELKQGSARLPTRVFVSSIKNYTVEKLSEQKMQSIHPAKQGLFRS